MKRLLVDMGQDQGDVLFPAAFQKVIQRIHGSGIQSRHAAHTKDQAAGARVGHNIPYLVCRTEEQRSSDCLLYTSPSPRDQRPSRMPSSA